MERNGPSSQRRALPRVCAGALLFALCFRPLSAPPAGAAEKIEGFDDERPAWSVHFDKARARLLAHRRNTHIFVRGKAAENLEFDTSRQGALLRMEYALPAARVIEELKLALWVRSNRPGSALFLRLVFPHQTDPATGAVLSTFIPGDAYERTGRWQQLSCSTTDRAVRDQVRRLRARLGQPQIDLRDAYVDRAVVLAQLEAGPTEFFLDELRFGPIVSPRADLPVVTIGGEEESEGPPVEFRLDRLTVEGRPFFPRVVPHHGDDAVALGESGVNVVWVADYRDERLLRTLREQSLWVTATPPRARAGDGGVLAAGSAGILPFGPATEPILFWNLGTRVPPEVRHEVMDWMEQIRRADRDYRRPVMVDVSGLERVISRHVPMLGVSRHTVNTSFSLKDYRDWLVHKRRIARPGSFVWTWVQTEALGETADWRAAAGYAPVVVEPEQLRLQVYAALAAGVRGLGYWKTAPLDDERPGGRERRLAITQLNLELELLEPWLAAGVLVGQTDVEIERIGTPAIDRGRIDFRHSASERGERDALIRERAHQLQRNGRIHDELEAAVIRTDDVGTLLLPVWYEHDAQFVPGQMAANGAKIVVHGVDESASAWLVTTTGVHSLPRERVTGGVQIVLDKFDQTAAVVLTSDRQFRAKMTRRIERGAATSAQVSVELAQAKLERVREVDTELRQLGAAQPDAPQILAKAASFVEHAEAALDRNDWHGAREFAGNSLQLVRILQRAHWNDAVRPLSSPVSSPHAACFQTLPDHWRMIARVGRSTPEDDTNLLRSGNFEDISTMVVEGWEHVQNEREGIVATAELLADAREGRYSLRLAALPEPGVELPGDLQRSPVVVTTPPIPARYGQVVHIGGWIRVAAAPGGTFDGVMLYDSIVGPAGALRWREKSGWQRFDVVREVRESGNFTLTMALTGVGDVRFDDLRVVPHDPRTRPTPESDAGGTRGRFDLLDRLPRLNPLPRDFDYFRRGDASEPAFEAAGDVSIGPTGEDG